MVKKGENFFEEHVEKIVIAVVAVACLWLLITRVFISPNRVEYDGKKWGSGRIDKHILNTKARPLEVLVNSPAKAMEPYKEKFGDYSALVESALTRIDTSLSMTLPDRPGSEAGIRGVYSLPQIPGVNDVAVDYLRAAAYIPTEEINMENFYAQSNSEPNNIDLVSVEGKIDVELLYDRFFEHFAGEDVRDDWRDPCLAEPVFAAVNLQRQQLKPDGSWTNWQDVPRTKVDHRRDTFDIIENVSELPTGGVKVRLLRYNDDEVRMDLLQPMTYSIASPQEDWLPPSLHKRFSELQKALSEIERREAKERKKKERMAKRKEQRDLKKNRDTGRGSRTGQRPVSTGFYEGGQGGRSSIAAGRAGGLFGSEGRRTTRGSRGRTGKRRSGPDKSEIVDEINKIYEEFEKLLLEDKKDLSRMREPLMFWTHDDTVEPENTYRYRIRFGVFNPIAGTNQLSEQDRRLKNQAILWSGFSETDSVEIPGRMYFFPSAVKELTKVVTLHVFKYVLGYWRTGEFRIQPGQIMGEPVEYEPKDEDTGTYAKANTAEPEVIDYSTGGVLVDVRPVKDWAGGNNMQARNYHEMLYSMDGTNIERMPIKTRYWADDARFTFNRLTKLAEDEREALQAWSGSGRTGRGGRSKQRFRTNRGGGEEDGGLRERLPGLFGDF